MDLGIIYNLLQKAQTLKKMSWWILENVVILRQAIR